MWRGYTEPERLFDTHALSDEFPAVVRCCWQVQLTDEYLEFQPSEEVANARNGQPLIGVRLLHPHRLVLSLIVLCAAKSEPSSKTNIFVVFPFIFLFPMTSWRRPLWTLFWSGPCYLVKHMIAAHVSTSPPLIAVIFRTITPVGLVQVNGSITRLE